MFSLVHFASPVICLASTTHKVSENIYNIYQDVCPTHHNHPKASWANHCGDDDRNQPLWRISCWFSPFKYFVLQNLQAHVAAQVAEAQQVAAKRQQAVSQMRGTDCVVGWLMAWKSSKIFSSLVTSSGATWILVATANFWHLKTEVCGVPVQLVLVSFIASRLFNRMFAVCKQKGVSCINLGGRRKCGVFGMSRVKTRSRLEYCSTVACSRGTFMYISCRWLDVLSLLQQRCLAAFQWPWRFWLVHASSNSGSFRPVTEGIFQMYLDDPRCT